MRRAGGWWDGNDDLRGWAGNGALRVSSCVAVHADRAWHNLCMVFNPAVHSVVCLMPACPPPASACSNKLLGGFKVADGDASEPEVGPYSCCSGCC